MAHLFHLTCLGHFRKIFHEDQFLKTVESNIGMPDEHKADPNDPLYDEPLVTVWPMEPRHLRDMPMIVPGEILKQMEEGGIKYPRATKSDWAGDPNTEQRVTMVVGFDPDSRTAPALIGEHVGPDVVWLTTDPTATQEWAYPEKQPLVQYKKDEILFVVDTEHLNEKKWSTWAFEQGIHQFWYDVLNNADNEAENWYVVDRPIPKKEWSAIYMAKSGRVIWLNPEKYDLPDGVFDKNGLIKPEREPELRALYPKPEAYFAARFREETF